MLFNTLACASRSRTFLILWEQNRYVQRCLFTRAVILSCYRCLTFMGLSVMLEGTFSSLSLAVSFRRIFRVRMQEFKFEVQLETDGVLAPRTRQDVTCRLTTFATARTEVMFYFTTIIECI